MTRAVHRIPAIYSLALSRLSQSKYYSGCRRPGHAAPQCAQAGRWYNEGECALRQRLAGDSGPESSRAELASETGFASAFGPRSAHTTHHVFPRAQTRCQSIEQTERGGHGGIDSNSSSSCPNLKFQRVGSLFGNSLPPHGSPRLHRRTGASAGGRRRAKRRPFRPGPVRTRMATCTGQGCRMGAEIQALRSLRELARLAGAPPWRRGSRHGPLPAPVLGRPLRQLHRG
jgi:hypothetical protein